jgi:hypothetical protein
MDAHTVLPPVAGAAQREVVRCRPAIVAHNEFGTVPAQWGSIAGCTASGTRG